MCGVAAEDFHLIGIQLGVAARLSHGLEELVQAGRALIAFILTALDYLAQKLGVLMELGDLSVGGGVLFQQLFGAERNGQQARLVQDLGGVVETTVPCG